MSKSKGETFERWVTAALVSVAVALLSWVWRYDSLPPGVWEDVAVAAGLRPPAAVFPLVWHMVVGQLFQWVEPTSAVRLLLIGGHCALGIASALIYLLLWETLPTIVVAARRVWWSRWVVRLVMFQGVLLFACADPVWEAGQAFGPDIFLLIAILTTVYIFVRNCVRETRVGVMCWNMILMGMVCAETPFGFLLVVGSLVVCYVKSRNNPDTIENPIGDPFVRVVVMRRMTALAMIGWLAMAAANSLYFMHVDGLKVHAWTGFEFVLHYMYHYVEIIKAAATPSGWLLLVVVVCVPLVFSLSCMGTAADDDRFLPSWYWALYVVMGGIAFLQVSGWRSFWFWTWTGESSPSVGSSLLRCVCATLSAQTATYALCVFAVETYIRNYFRIAGVKYQDSIEGSRFGADMAMSFRQISRVGRFVMFFEPLVFLAVLLPWRVQPMTREVVRILNESASLAAKECADVRYLFTDGASDAAVEISALEQGRRLYAVSMMSGNSPRERYLRTRGTDDPEDREMLNRNSVDTLRTWMRLKQSRHGDFAFQLGFELWGRGQIPAKCAGVSARLGDYPKGVAEAGIQAVHALLDRILKMYGLDEKLESISPLLRDRLAYVQWRLARLCRARADLLEAQSKPEESLAESQLADKIDEHNVVFQKMRQRLEMAGRGSMRLTPREGLKLGLEHANFRMAEMFAHQVLASDPYDVSANFVVGMNYFSKGQYGRAEIYFKKCLERRPNDPAILNNLAVSQLRQDKIEDAEANARKSLEVYPDAQEAKRTLDNVLKKKKEFEEQKRRKKLMGL